MKRVVFAVIGAVIFCGSSQASDDWKARGADLVTEQYDRAISAEWVDGASLWLTAMPASVSWDTVAEDLVCGLLSVAGKPKGERVLVAFYDHSAAQRGEAERMGEAFCPD